MNILDFGLKKVAREKIAMVTCYDYTSAILIADTAIDCVLVGDSVAMTMHGFKDTLSATVSMMALHTAAVSRGLRDQFLIADLPFLSYRKSLSENMASVEIIMQAGAHAVKLEGAIGNLALISHLVASGVPVMGHLGLTPQFVNVLGGYKVQGKDEKASEKLKEEALQLQSAGCFALVLECVPANLAKEITESLMIPTIGIGAGSETDGQVLVFQDLLGLNKNFKPKFVKTFVEGFDVFKIGLNDYVKAVKSGEFPSHENSFEDRRLAGV